MFFGLFGSDMSESIMADSEPETNWQLSETITVMTGGGGG